MSSILLSNARRTVRADVNPLDRATVVSLYPRPIREIKHTITPGIFEIEAGTYEKPSVLVVGPSSWWREIDETQPLLEITNSAVQVANSIIMDYLNGLMEYAPGEASPGLFFIPGRYDLEKIRADYSKLLLDAKNKQQEWFKRLVRLADILWARSNGNPICICDDMRLAAETLGQKSKPWMQDFSSVEMVNCPACGAIRNPTFPVCSVCNTVIDVKKFAELGLEKRK